MAQGLCNLQAMTEVWHVDLKNRSLFIIILAMIKTDQYDYQWDKNGSDWRKGDLSQSC